MSANHDLLLVGGYGVVGRRIAALLAPEFPDRVVVAGRNLPSAETLCTKLRHGARARTIDTNDGGSIERALEGVSTVVSCVAQRDLGLLRQTISRGLSYTDISPHLAHWSADQGLKQEALRTGARVVLGAGLSPGISNVMARKAAAEVGPVERVETNIFLSLGDEFGPDSLHHLVDSITQPFTLFVNGRVHNALPFTDGLAVDFPAPVGTRTAYLFPWSDVVSYPQTLGAQTAIGRFALDPTWLGKSAALLVRAGARSWLKHISNADGGSEVIDRLKRRYAGKDSYALVVSVKGANGTREMSLVGTHQADVTAAGAAAIVRPLATRTVSTPGVFLPEEVIEHEPYFELLARWGYHPDCREVTHESL